MSDCERFQVGTAKRATNDEHAALTRRVARLLPMIGNQSAVVSFLSSAEVLNQLICQ
jgi:hypothetical protein